MKDKFAWFQYRIKRSYGAGEWQYVELKLPFTKQAENIFKEDLAEDFSYDVSFRSIEIRKAKKIPSYVLKSKIAYLDKDIKSKQEALKRAKKQLEKIPQKKYVFYVSSQGFIKANDDYVALKDKKGLVYGEKWKKILADDIFEARVIADKMKEKKRKGTK